MIQLRFRSQFEPEWTDATLDGEEEEASCSILCGWLLRQEAEVLISRDCGEFVPLDEEEGL